MSYNAHLKVVSGTKKDADILCAGQMHGARAAGARMLDDGGCVLNLVVMSLQPMFIGLRFYVF